MEINNENSTEEVVGTNSSDSPPKASRLKLVVTIAAFVALFAGGIAGGYFYFFMKSAPGSGEQAVIRAPRPGGPITEIVVYFPSGGRLKSETRAITGSPSRLDAARITVEEFLKGPSGIGKSYIPQGTDLLGIYDGQDGILYIDLTDEFRRNLQVDAIAEFLLMRGLYESILANVYGVADVKILIEGNEVETLGGHISVLRPLGDTVSQTIEEE